MTIRDLLQTPFGPYKEKLVLESKCKSIKGDVLTLHDFIMECGGGAVGFDQSEDRNCPAIGQKSVRFRGTLEIQSLSWLTSVAHQLIEGELRERDVRLHFQKELNPVNKLTLSELYSPSAFGESGLKIRVIVQCDKLPLGAAFYTSRLAPEGLIVRSIVKQEDQADLTREYQILSINVGTYEHSQNYLRRYQLLHLMEKIVEKKYKPISERTINYFVRVYLKHFAFTERHRYSRWIHGESDSDVDTDGNTTLPRHPRPLHRSEVISVFASQAEWILQDQMSKRSMYRLVDVDIWRDFCERVQRDRKEAARWGVRWGLAKGMEVELSSDDEPCRVVKPKKLGKGKKYTKRKTKARVISPSPVRSDDEGFANSYDEDFSQPSTPTTTDEDELSDMPIDPELYAMIPRSFCRSPMLPKTGLTWFCDVRECAYKIDLLNLTDENVQRLGPQVREGLMSKQWGSIREKRVKTAFFEMVNHHFETHMLQWGIKFTDEGKPAWIYPKRHRPWPEPVIRGTGRIRTPSDDEMEE